MNTATTEQLIDADTLAEHWSCSRQHIYKLMRSGMPSLSLGRSRRYRLSECEAWLNTQQDGAA